MLQTLSRSFNAALLDVIPAYREVGEKWPATARELALFAINNGYWEPQRSKLVSLCGRDIARAMREQKHVDPQGRTVRTMHAAKSPRTNDDGSETQLVLWDDIREAGREHVEVAFQQHFQFAKGLAPVAADAELAKDVRPRAGIVFVK